MEAPLKTHQLCAQDVCLCKACSLGNTCLLAFVNLVVLWVSLGAVEGIGGKAGGGCRKV